MTGLTGIPASYAGFITGKKESWPVSGASALRAEGYDYDDSGRLVSVINSDGTDQIKYDVYGNIQRVGLTQYLYSGYRLSQLREGFLNSGFSIMM